ncbi:sigma-54 interaction domain-containing protein [Caloramator proteoclasticus]|uniref:Sigma-54 interaction domain-containing protein n=1 Tax=Caloramator proteoclasticus DSM 10124 TaxID=1121262 RepID=A0A1M4T1L1_9CLOT|nr:sigma 54-interacting transcriptional regulator [Caloramator proteoclasticus]SHE38260.1 Sigma-54 interaction domain-containing protein [Caloramator proteoclasticus DSM 10124]
MKSIALVTNRKGPLSEFLRENLNEVFANKIDINNYYLYEMKEGEKIKDNVILVMIDEKAYEIQKFASIESCIIVIERTLREKEIYKIAAIPNDTKVLVVNDTKETTIETVNLLHRIGISHLKLIPYLDNKVYEDVKVAITPGESDKVPDFIETTIDVGHRCIDIATFLKIFNCLEIKDKEIEENLIKYSEGIVSKDMGIKRQYMDLFIKGQQLEVLIEHIQDAIAIVDNEEKVVLTNSSFNNLFNFKIGSSLIFNNEEIDNLIKKDEIKGEIIRYRNQIFSVNKEPIKYLNYKSGYIISFADITNIKRIEQNISKKIREKGFYAKYNFDMIITYSNRMKECIDIAKKISKSDYTVLITGESGTGKEMMAQSIHNYSNRSNYPFVAVNCAALPENLLESELFGYEKGAFTGALKEGKTGLFEIANNGTIFLDEIGDMPLKLQTRLLRVLQEKQIMRVGSENIINVNVRVIAATNKDLKKLVDQGLFREDLYFRLNVLPINLPPLRERREDIMPLLKCYLERDIKFENEVEKLLLNYRWPGNIRELKNIAIYLNALEFERVALNDLPQYILNSELNFDKELDFIKNNYNFEKVLDVLECIEKSEGVGRRCISEKLSYIGEGEVRGILELLNDLGMINKNIGRSGTKINNKGRMFLNWTRNGIK